MKWESIFETENPQRAEIVKSILEKKGFQPVIINKKDSAYLFGLMQIQVSQEEVLLAIKELEDIKFE